ncbi:MAG: YggS family pyridoxal phosphate-dependent enzyme [Polyangiaceae bacterium]|jgi:PLP dependent protein
MTIASRLEEVRGRVARAADAAGRDPALVRLVAVSKTKPPDAIREAYAAGQRAFGESYAQELVGKTQALADLTDIEWHFVGHLQTNKAKLAAKHASVVHTVDSAALARELGKRVAKERVAPLPVLIEVNVGGETQKAGATPGDIDEVMVAVCAQPALALRGLMTVPPAGTMDDARRVFATLATLRSLHGGVAALPELSMGMSEDLEVAVECGATYVRVGSAIFGAR